MNRFLLPSTEYVTCVPWNLRYHITGTDIVRALAFRFEASGDHDLRSLKPEVDACLEEPEYQCIHTQKKQQIFYWWSVPHDRLFLDALECDLKRENMGFEPATTVVGEPALSFTYDPRRSL
ncbi:STE-domain-containing protein [Rhizopogon salebrosus TDB-379]|nr:STE-domain-containing protein [Rhizopogon salebrosus TDB-379]